MHRLLQRTDWSFLVGAEVMQIVIGRHDIQIVLSDAIVIAIHSGFEHTRRGHELSTAGDTARRATTLVSLLGRKIQRVAAEGEEALVLSFDNHEVLALLVAGGAHESLAITHRNRIVAV
ncbi:MAG: hypothetical protein JSR90_09690 [Proteobacteria bacterium]|nr:hypothetical protein [Pseudomonadota bacterium]